MLRSDGRADAVRLAEPAPEVDRFFAMSANGPAALVVEGEAGSGRSTVWAAVMASARERGWLTMTAQPAPSEVMLSYAGLGDLLGSIAHDVLPQLPGPQARALAACLLQAEPQSRGPDLRAVGTAVVSLLRIKAAAGPVIVGVDDARWLDEPTRTVLSFALRRLGAMAVGVVVSMLVPDETTLPLGLERAWTAPERIVRRRLGPLGPAAIREVVARELGVTVSARTLQRLHRVSGGNPLIARELARHQPSGPSGLAPDAIMELPGGLAQLMAARLAGLGSDCVETLAMVAAAAIPTLDLISDLLGSNRAASTLGEAVDAGVISLDGGRVRFTHAMLASAAYASITAPRRRALHRRLAAAVGDPEERARHLALATVGFDDSAAAVVELGARAARRRGSPEVAGALAEQAATLTSPDQGDDRARRALLAVRYLVEAGARDRAGKSAARLLDELPPGPARMEALCLLADTRRRSEDLLGGIDLLGRALIEAGDDSACQARAQRDLAFFFLMAMAPAEVAAHADAAARAAHTAGERGLLAQATALAAIASFLRGGGFDRARLESCLAAGGQLDTLAIDYRPATWLAILAKYAGELDAARAGLAAEREAVAAEGLEVGLAGLLWQMIELETWAGHLALAATYAEEALDAAKLTSSEHELALALAARAGVHLAAGELDRARVDGLDAVRIAERIGSALAVGSANALLGDLELCSNRPADAHARLGPLVQLAAAAGIGEPGLLRSVPADAQALIALGRPQEALQLLAPYEARARALGRASALGLAARVRGLALAADGRLDAAIETLDEAARCSQQSGFVLDAARTRLLLGRVRRRARDRRGARSSFQAARVAFEQAGAAGWTARADDELDHLGLRRAPAGLTASEYNMATLAAAGSTNAQIARQFDVSRRTVEANLARAYAKLGITSRQQLAAVLSPAKRQHPSGP